jgi:hypothetical protein
MTKASFRVDDKTGELIEVPKEPNNRLCPCGCGKTIEADDTQRQTIHIGQYL